MKQNERPKETESREEGIRMTKKNINHIKV
jgi:hypothetical protein